MFTCFALPDPFSAVPRASGSFFTFCAPGIIFGSTECVRSRFHVFRTRNLFYILSSWTRIRLYRGRLVPFSCFAHPDSFSAVPRAPGSVFMFCAPGLIFGGTVGVGSRFHVLRSRTSFPRCQMRWVPFSCFARPNLFSTVSGASNPDFIFYAPVPIFSGTEVVGFLFHVLRARNHFRRYRVRQVSFSCFAHP
jgi:hypothetical protein